jgi:serine/threonine protein kinase
MTTTVRPNKRCRTQFDVQYSDSNAVNDFITYCGNVSLAKEPLTDINLQYCKIDLQYMRDLRYHPFIVANSCNPHRKLICNIIIDRMMYAMRACVATPNVRDKFKAFHLLCLAIPTVVLFRKQRDMHFSSEYVTTEEAIVEYASVQSCELYNVVKSEVSAIPISFYIDSLSIATWLSIAYEKTINRDALNKYRDFIFNIAAIYLRSHEKKENVGAAKLAFASMQCARDCYQMNKISERDPTVVKLAQIIDTAQWGSVPKPSTNIASISFSPYEAYEDKASLIGSGSYGSLFAVKLRNAKDEYRVIKRLIISEQSKMYEFVRERNILAFSSHDHILKAYRSFVINYKNAYIEMEFAEMGDLMHLLQTHLISNTYMNQYAFENITSAVIIPVIEAVRYLHSFQIAHGDLKLNNVVMTKDYKIKLVDFGMAINALAPTYFDDAWADPKTMYKDYACRYAPEFSISSVNGSLLPATQFDVWAVGNLAYEIYSILFTTRYIAAVDKDNYMNVYNYVRKLVKAGSDHPAPTTRVEVPNKMLVFKDGLEPIFQAKDRSFDALYNKCKITLKDDFHWKDVIKPSEERRHLDMNLNVNSVFPAIDPHKNVALNDVDLYDISSDERSYMMMDALKEDEYL